MYNKDKNMTFLSKKKKWVSCLKNISHNKTYFKHEQLFNCWKGHLILKNIIWLNLRKKQLPTEILFLCLDFANMITADSLF